MGKEGKAGLTSRPTGGIGLDLINYAGPACSVGGYVWPIEFRSLLAIGRAAIGLAEGYLQYYGPAVEYPLLKVGVGVGRNESMPAYPVVVGSHEVMARDLE